LTHPAGYGERVALTYVPPFPTHPPEFAYMTVEQTSLPCLYLREETSNQGRVAYLPADVDRTCWRLHQPDHAELLASLVRWVVGDDPSDPAGQALPVRVSGPGLIDVHAYVQGGRQRPVGSGTLEGAERLIVHLVNCTHAGTWRAPVDALNPVGEQRLRVTGRQPARARLLVMDREAALESDGSVVIPSVLDHEVVVVELAG
jgi:hypothetical protein